MVSAYDSDHQRKQLPVRVGDEVEWKKNGVAGGYRCRVTALGKTKVQVLLLYHTWSPAQSLDSRRPVWINRRVQRVYPATATTQLTTP